MSVGPASFLLPVSKASERLGVHPSRIHHMLRDGSLKGAKVGGQWWIDPWSLERQRVLEATAGRPYGEANAWALLNLWEARPVDWVSKWERSRLRRRLRDNDILDLAPRFRRRAAVQRYRVHPGMLDELASDPAVVRSGISAAADYSADILGGRELEGYADGSALRSLEQRYALAKDSSGNVLLHVVEDESRLTRRGNVMSPVVVALDLMESVDARSRRAGQQLLERLRDDQDPD